MAKIQRREILLGIGTIVLLLGVTMLYDSFTRPLILQTVALKVIEFIGGGLVSIIGLYVFAWGVSDKAGENASEFLRDVWDRFLRALGK
jgi:hypothetical protein